MEILLALLVHAVFGSELSHDVLVHLAVGVYERNPPLLVLGSRLLGLLLLDSRLVHEVRSVQDHKSNFGTQE